MARIPLSPTLEYPTFFFREGQKGEAKSDKWAYSIERKIPQLLLLEKEVFEVFEVFKTQERAK
jgi:hypothetical protein